MKDLVETIIAGVAKHTDSWQFLTIVTTGMFVGGVVILLPHYWRCKNERLNITREHDRKDKRLNEKIEANRQKRQNRASKAKKP